MVLLLELTGCVLDPAPDFHSQPPEQLLFDRAMSAMWYNRWDVARLTLQTLVNTHPDSEYAARAERMLEDSRLAECGGSENIQSFNDTSPVREDGGATAPAATELEFFPAPNTEQLSPDPSSP